MASCEIFPSPLYAFTFKYSPLKLLSKIKNKFGWDGPFKIVPDSLDLHLRWMLLLKIEMSLIVFCLIIIQNELKF